MNARRSLVEFGGGFSTLVLARALKELGSGTLVTVEHDEHWAARLTELLRAEGLDSIAEVALCPIDAGTGWYQADAVDLSLTGKEADLVLVDGPLAYRSNGIVEEHPRFPALAALRPHLAPEFSLFLDDIHRSGELAVLKAWAVTLGAEAVEDYHRGKIGHIHVPDLGVNL